MTTAAPRKRASLFTLGCRLNQAETAILRERLAAGGYDIVPFGEPADLTIVNTCTVTAGADAKSRKVLRGFIRDNPAAYIAAVGCYAQIGHESLARIPGIDLIVGTEEKLNILDYARYGKNPAPLIIREAVQRSDFSIDTVAGHFTGHRANLKIQDGCDFMCSFCVIPFARGRARSREFQNLLDEARALVDRGAPELVLTGVNVGTYAQGGRDLLNVLDALNEIEGLRRIRISSIEPTTVPDGLFDRMNDPEHALVPYLHLPIQSGSDRILAQMRRRYSRANLTSFLDRAVERVAGLCIGTDVLVGFPGESVADFEETCSLVEHGPFAYAHVFKYSERPGTASVRLPDKVNGREADRRAARIRWIAARNQRAFHARFAGETLPVLFEHEENGLWFGYTGNYIRVAVRSNDILENELRDVVLGESCGDFVTGTLHAGKAIEVGA